MFFPGGVSAFGKAEFMEFTLANYKEDIVSNVVGAAVPFTLQRYVNATKLLGARLYLASKMKQCESQVSDEGLFQPMIDLTTVRKPEPEKDRAFQGWALADYGLVEDANAEKNNSPLQSMKDLKTTRDLIAELQKEYQESLLADQCKVQQRKEQLLGRFVRESSKNSCGRQDFLEFQTSQRRVKEWK